MKVKDLLPTKQQPSGISSSQEHKDTTRLGYIKKSWILWVPFWTEFASFVVTNFDQTIVFGHRTFEIWYQRIPIFSDSEYHWLLNKTAE